VGELSLDGGGCVTEVDGPDGAGAVPVEDVDEELVVAKVEASEAAEKVGEFVPREFRASSKTELTPVFHTRPRSNVAGIGTSIRLPTQHEAIRAVFDSSCTF
jgi:hypothetical protein